MGCLLMPFLNVMERDHTLNFPSISSVWINEREVAWLGLAGLLCVSSGNTEENDSRNTPGGATAAFVV